MRKEFSWGGLIVIALWAACMALALWLQNQYYMHSGAFYDSVSYYQQLAEHLQQAKDEGFWPALRDAFKAPNSAMPWVQAAILSLFTHQPQMWMGPIMQAPWILLFWLSLYAFFRKVAVQSQGASVLMTLPFIFNTAMWYFSRGWADFGIDLMSYIVLGNGLIFYIWSFYTTKGWPLIMSGVLLGFCSWWRPVTLVYQALILAPTELLGIIFSNSKILYLKRWLYLGIPLGVLALGYVLYNFNNLADYYFKNNYDVIAHLPLSQSIQHATFLYYKISFYTLLLACTWCACRIAVTAKEALKNKNIPPLASVNFLALWCGLVPVGYLIISGSGLNRDVCMVSIFGILMFLLWPLKNRFTLPRWTLIVLTGLSLWTAGSVLAEQYSEYMPCTEISSRFEIESLIDAMTRDAQRRRLKNVPFAVGSEWRQFSAAWIHLLVYQRGATFKSGDAIYQGITYVPVVPWADQKMMEMLDKNDNAALKESFDQLDYICLPDPQTIEFFAQRNSTHPAVPYIKKYIAAAKRLAILTPISSKQGWGAEQYQLYRVDHSLPGN